MHETCCDLQGLVFCVGSNRGVLRLYDPRNYEHGPFATFLVGAAHI